MILEKYRESSGIKIFHDGADEEHDDYNSQGLDVLYNEEEKHFWFIARKEFIYQQIKNIVSPSSKIIEIGAGTGNVSRYLKSKGYTGIAIGEMHIKGLQYAKSYGINECYQFDLLRTPFEKEFDAICLFDVLEHIEEDSRALENINKMLTAQGHVILTVPAHTWLWNRDDLIAGHKRRYTKNELFKKLEKSGLKVIVSRYFFISIVPLLFLRRFLHRDDGTDILPEEYQADISMNPVLNNILLYLSRFENKFNGYLPNILGGSLLVVATKK
ncbi:MAG: class I SAM-dependent methyltransferase [Sulfurovum sp.]|nr:class I SAM-dependent methyltransferase [Sulfurovum sp.]NNJ45032.1 class I SAM-dependent methyltransferase [Sulfurovum sp.]